MNRYFLICLLPLLATALSAQSQPVLQNDLGNYYIDFAVPDLSAFTLAGVESSQIARPGNVRALSVALANSLGTLGEQGTGIEISPYQMLSRSQAEDYKAEDYKGLLARLTLSAAAIQQEAGGSKVAIGLRWVPIDKADPYEPGSDLRKDLNKVFNDRSGAQQIIDDARAFGERYINFLTSLSPNTDFIKKGRLVLQIKSSDPFLVDGNLDSAVVAVRNRLTKIGEDLEGFSPDAINAQELRELVVEYREVALSLRQKEMYTREKVIQARRNFKETKWNKLSLQVAGGFVASTNGDIDDLKEESLSGFAGISFPLIPNSQMIIHAQGNWVFNDSDDRLVLGGRFLYGNANRRFSLEGLYGANDNRLGEDRYRLLIGGEVRLANGVYLEIAAGPNLPEGGNSSLLTLGSLRYGIGQGQRFDLPEN